MDRDTFAVATLRLRGTAADTPALRLRAARELQAADLTPEALPPSAVLVVRHLSDPMPGRFGGARLRPPPEWERAVRRTLAGAAQSAARPDERGRLPPTADAVLFADEAELLACLIADRVRGDLIARWWWRSVLPRLGIPAAAADAGRTVAPFLRARPRHLPAALALLVRWGEAARVAGALTPSDAAAVLASLAREHALPEEMVSRPSSRALEREDGEPAARDDRQPAIDRPPGDAIGVRSAAAVSAPWSEWLPAVIDEARVAPEVQCFLGVALALHAAPGRLRSAHAVAQARRWWLTATQPRVEQAGLSPRAGGGRYAEISTPAVHPQSERELRAALPREIAAADVAGSSMGASAAPDVEAGRTSADLQPPPGGTIAAGPLDAHDTVAPRTARNAVATSRREEQTRVAAEAGVERSQARAIADAATEPARAMERPGDAERAGHRAPETPASPAPAPFPAGGVATDVGGVLYLIHALQDLGLPDAFDPRWDLAANGGPWGALDLVARALFGARFAKVANDPLWNVLPQLAGRRVGGSRSFAGTEAAAPGRASDPAFRVPPNWLQRLGDAGDRFRWTVAGGRVWIWSPLGYLVAHRPCRAATSHDVRRDLASMLSATGAPPRLARCRRSSAVPWTPPLSLPSGCPPRLGRWAAALAPAVRRRVRLALGAEDAGAVRSTRADPIHDVLAIPGRLYVTSSHVDLVMRLDRADLALRRAGLDRDPGWLPAYGRVVYFHFE